MFPQLFGKYVLEREIAKGGMARVFLATLRGAVGFEKRLVVKQIRPELASDEAFVKRFVEEAKTAVELGHPNIVPVYELGVEQGIYYIAMDLCEGATLAEVLAETGTLTPEEGAYVGIEICRALDYAHRRAGVVHRDVTPRNVMLDEEGAVRLIDFGIAAPATMEEAGKPPTEVFGSPGHMPPEQIAGSSLSPATDVFAVAVLLAEAWTGAPPFRRATAAECRAALKSPPPSVAEGNPELAPLAELVASSMALDPSARPETAEALARPLREFVKSADLGDLARRLGTRVRRTRRKLLASAPWLLGEDDDSTSPVASETGPVQTRPRAPSIGDTQTFAVRNDLVEWTRRLPSAPPPPDEAVVEPVAPSATLSTRKLTTPEVDPRESEAVSARSAGDEREDRDQRPSAEGVATSKGVTGSRDGEPGRARSGNRGWLAVPALLAAVGLGWWGARSTLPGGEQPTPSDGAPAVSAPAPTATRSSGVPAPPSSMGTAGSEPSAPTSSRPLPSVPSSVGAPTSSGAPQPATPHGSVATAATTAAQVSGEKAVVSLTANPPSLVSLGGRSYGTTPVVGVQLPAGSYSVSFENPTLGLRTGSRITLSAGARRSVHADFTLATPSVSVR